MTTPTGISIECASTGPTPQLAGRRGVIVAGMHRSGTSALTRVLSLCGLNLPVKLVPPNAGNVRGHWESEPICQLNDRILSHMGLHWISWQSPSCKIGDLPDKPALLAEAAALLDSEFGAEGDFVLKDPRICRLLPFWREVFALRGIRPCIVLAYRHPVEVGRSLEARNGILPAYGHLAWLRFMLDAERASRADARVTVGFEALVQDWRAVAMSISNWLNAEGADLSAIDSKAIESFLSNELRHFATADEPLAPWTRQVQAILEGWTRKEESPDDYATLDGIAIALNAAEPVFNAIVEPTDRIRQLEAELFAAHKLIAKHDRPLPIDVPAPDE